MAMARPLRVLRIKGGHLARVSAHGRRYINARGDRRAIGVTGWEAGCGGSCSPAVAVFTDRPLHPPLADMDAAALSFPRNDHVGPIEPGRTRLAAIVALMAVASPDSSFCCDPCAGYLAGESTCVLAKPEKMQDSGLGGPRRGKRWPSREGGKGLSGRVPGEGVSRGDPSRTPPPPGRPKAFRSPPGQHVSVFHRRQSKRRSYARHQRQGAPFVTRPFLSARTLSRYPDRSAHGRQALVGHLITARSHRSPGERRRHDQQAEDGDEGCGLPCSQAPGSHPRRSLSGVTCPKIRAIATCSIANLPRLPPRTASSRSGAQGQVREGNRAPRDAEGHQGQGGDREGASGDQHEDYVQGESLQACAPVLSPAVSRSRATYATLRERSTPPFCCCAPPPRARP